MSERATEILQRPDLDSPGVAVNGVPAKTAGMGGAYEGADRLGRELATWRPRVVSADGAMSQRDKLLLDSRSNDILRNSGQIQGASYVYKDSIVGSQYRLNAHPNTRVLGLDEDWADEFQQEVEAKFMLWADSEENWVDASRMNNFTALVRLAVGCNFAGGEVLAVAEWIRSGRPFSTAIQMVDCDRLSNPNDGMDTARLRRGVEKNHRGEPIAYHIRRGHPTDDRIGLGRGSYTWDRVAARKRWGRLQVIHILEQNRPDMTRGVADLAAVLKETRMAKKFHEVSLQNAIVNASYAAAIESELPHGLAFESIGGANSESAVAKESLAYLELVSAYARGGRNLEIDGVKIPHLVPGSKLRMMPAGTVGGVGQSFEDSLHYYISAGLGVSYEEYTHNYSKTNYSSSKAASNATRRRMLARKRACADRFANSVYTLWLEEAAGAGQIESLNHVLRRNPDFLYEGMNLQALARASWIGASIGQVDEMKETQAAIMRIKNHLSTWEIECSRLGNDYRDIFQQAARETKQIKMYGLNPSLDATKPGTLNDEREGSPGAGDAAAREEAYGAGAVDQDGFDEDGNQPFNDGFDDE